MEIKKIDAIDPPELPGEEGWTELKIPDSYGKGRAFITGDKTPDRLMVRYFKKQSDKSFVARVWFGPATEGPAGFVHGGSIASILDEAMGAAVWLIGFTAVSARITVDYRKMLHLGTVTLVEANVISVNGSKIVSGGKISGEAGTIYAESKGLYINLPAERFGKMIHYRNQVEESLSGTDNNEQ